MKKILKKLFTRKGKKMSQNTSSKDASTTKKVVDTLQILKAPKVQQQVKNKGSIGWQTFMRDQFGSESNLHYIYTPLGFVMAKNKDLLEFNINYLNGLLDENQSAKLGDKMYKKSESIGRKSSQNIKVLSQEVIDMVKKIDEYNKKNIQELFDLLRKTNPIYVSLEHALRSLKSYAKTLKTENFGLLEMAVDHEISKLSASQDLRRV